VGERVGAVGGKGGGREMKERNGVREGSGLCRGEKERGKLVGGMRSGVNGGEGKLEVEGGGGIEGRGARNRGEEGNRTDQ